VLTREDNELLTNVEKGSPTGEVFRRFWIPAVMSEELPGPDCETVEITSRKTTRCSPRRVMAR
jgi:hypothetical protein